MSHPFMSQAWVDALVARTAESTGYKSATKGWDIYLAFARKPEADKGISAAGMVLTIKGGEIVKAEHIEGPGPYEGDFVIRGEAENWKSVLTKEVFPVPAIMKGKLQLVKGNAMSLMTKMKNFEALLEEAGALPTDYAA